MENLGNPPAQVAQNPQLREFKYQTVEIAITQAAANANTPSKFSASFETDRQYKRVVGVAFEIIPTGGSTPNTDFLKIGRFEIQNREIYSDGLPVKTMLNSSDVKPNDKFDRWINEEANGNKVSIDLNEYNTGTFVSYKVAVILMLSNRTQDISPEVKK